MFNTSEDISSMNYRSDVRTHDHSGHEAHAGHGASGDGHGSGGHMMAMTVRYFSIVLHFSLIACHCK